MRSQLFVPLLVVMLALQGCSVIVMEQVHKLPASSPIYINATTRDQAEEYLGKPIESRSLNSPDREMATYKYKYYGYSGKWDKQEHIIMLVMSLGMLEIALFPMSLLAALFHYTVMQTDYIDVTYDPDGQVINFSQWRRTKCVELERWSLTQCKY